MTLKEIRQQWEKGRNALLALSTPNRDKVFVLLHNPHSRSDFKEEYSIYEYTQDKDGKWTVWFNPNFSEFEHLEQGLEYLNKKFKLFLPQ
jgi:hypothetical protein